MSRLVTLKYALAIHIYMKKNNCIVIHMIAYDRTCTIKELSMLEWIKNIQNKAIRKLADLHYHNFTFI